MILDEMHLAKRMSVDKQEKIIEDIKNATSGSKLFVAATWKNTDGIKDIDVIETLLYKSGVTYGIINNGCISIYYKE